MELAKLKACICEGAAEAAIMDVLLDNDLLVFQREEMLDESVIRCRDGKNFVVSFTWKEFRSWQHVSCDRCIFNSNPI